MSVNYNDDLAHARLQNVIDAIDAGAGPGKLEIGTAGMATLLASITLDDPSFGAPAGRQISLAGLPKSDTDADATGTAAEARIVDSDDTVVVSGLTVGTVGSGANIEMTNVNLQIHQVVDLVAGTIIHP